LWKDHLSLKNSTMFQQRGPARRKTGRAARAPGSADPTASSGRVITGVAAVEALAYPLRQELIDTVTAFGGEAAAGELAEHLGRPVDGLYYHLRLLVGCGLLVEELARNRAGRQERRYRLAAGGRGALRLAYRPEPAPPRRAAGGTGTGRRPARRSGAAARARTAAALRKVVAGMLRIAGRDFERALADEEVVVEGKRRQLWAARSKGWVSAAELEEVNRLLVQLTELFDRPRSDERQHLMSLCFALAPVAARPKRRGGGAE
jgi:hypothetical protein